MSALCSFARGANSRLKNIMVTMSMPSRLELLKKIKARYLQSSKENKTRMLDELCQNVGYNRKYAIRRFSPKIDLEKPKTTEHRKGSWTYTNEDIYWLVKVWEIMDYPCGQRLQPMLGEIIDKLIKFKELNIPEAVVAKLKTISSASIDNRLKIHRQKLLKKINSTTRPGSLIKKQIPIRTVSWDEKRIGYCELDTVAHCGNSAQGDFINSLNLTDLLTSWTEAVAVMGKAQKRIVDGLNNIKARLPFPLRGIDPDNGSEFINWQLFECCLKQQIEFTRGRPYQKNDSAHIEQKNWIYVRKIFGYQRRETEKELNLMNDLYQNELGLYHNFFMPSVKLIKKRRVGKHQEKIKRIYDQARTPYQRVLECKQVSKGIKQQLKKEYDKLNPAALRRKILSKLNKLSKIHR